MKSNILHGKICIIILFTILFFGENIILSSAIEFKGDPEINTNKDYYYPSENLTVSASWTFNFYPVKTKNISISFFSDNPENMTLIDKLVNRFYFENYEIAEGSTFVELILNSSILIDLSNGSDVYFINLIFFDYDSSDPLYGEIYREVITTISILKYNPSLKYNNIVNNSVLSYGDDFYYNNSIIAEENNNFSYSQHPIDFELKFNNDIIVNEKIYTNFNGELKLNLDSNILNQSGDYILFFFINPTLYSNSKNFSINFEIIKIDSLYILYNETYFEKYITDDYFSLKIGFNIEQIQDLIINIDSILDLLDITREENNFSILFDFPYSPEKITINISFFHPIYIFSNLTYNIDFFKEIYVEISLKPDKIKLDKGIFNITGQFIDKMNNKPFYFTEIESDFVTNLNISKFIIDDNNFIIFFEYPKYPGKYSIEIGWSKNNYIFEIHIIDINFFQKISVISFNKTNIEVIAQDEGFFLIKGYFYDENSNSTQQIPNFYVFYETELEIKTLKVNKGEFLIEIYFPLKIDEYFLKISFYLENYVIDDVIFKINVINNPRKNNRSLIIIIIIPSCIIIVGLKTKANFKKIKKLSNFKIF